MLTVSSSFKSSSSLLTAEVMDSSMTGGGSAAATLLRHRSNSTADNEYQAVFNSKDVTFNLKPQGDPTHHAASERIAQGMFLVFVVERIVDGHGHFSLVMPESVSATQVQQGVTIDRRTGRG
jgi:hypothetical protein